MQPKNYFLAEHRIPHEKIDAHAYYIIEKLKKEGFVAYLVGGSVRDLLLGYRPKDFDIATSARPEQIKKIFRNSILIGKRFRLAHIRFGNKIFEVATFRAGDPEAASLILRDNVWGTPEEDVLRRDFTINGLFYDPETQVLIDYVEGFEDAQKKLLRTIGHADVRFRQDPVRMIRLIKFQARFGFTIEEKTQNALMSCKKEILKSSPPRILEELLRMLELGASQKFFELLLKGGLLTPLLPTLAHFLEKNEENLIFRFLEQIDLSWKKHPSERYTRTTLLATLLFPLLEKKLLSFPPEKKKGIHLGMIADFAREVIDEFFLPFFHLPRKMKIGLISILVHQYRLTPLTPFFPEGKIPKRLRIPKDPFFKEALEFCKLRTLLDSSSLPNFLLWHEAWVNSHIKEHSR